MGKRILIIPDAHAKPNVSNRRFEWLGYNITKIVPDVIIELGDFADMESLSSYDKGKKSFEGRRISKDIQAAASARDILDHYIKKLRKKPRLVSCVGNHENRVFRVMNDIAELDGLINFNDLYPNGGWESVPYGETKQVCGYSVSHNFVSGVMGRPIGGKNHAQRLLDTQHESCIAGHSHLWAYAEATKPSRKKIQAFVAGCFLDPLQVENYAGPANNMWYKGITVLDNVDQGYAPDFVRIGMLTLRKFYEQKL